MNSWLKRISSLVNSPKRLLAIVAQPGAEAFLRPVINLSSATWQVRLLRYGWGQDSVENADEVALDDIAAALREFANFKPDLVITSLSYCPAERALLRAAREHSIPVVQLLETWYDYAARVADTNGVGVFPDEIFVLDETARTEAIADGLPASILVPVGHPAWEAKRENPAVTEGGILIIDQPLRSDIGCAELGYDEYVFFEIVKQSIKITTPEPTEIYLALHPRRSSHEDIAADGWHVVKDASTYLERCRLVVGVFSSFLIDAYLAGSGVVSVLPKMAKENKCYLSSRNFIPTISAPCNLSLIDFGDRERYREFKLRFDQSSLRVLDRMNALVERYG